ncbi:hypothetical protein ACHAXS_009168 [Conticribra weissflogii]
MTANHDSTPAKAEEKYGRTSPITYKLTPTQIQTFHSTGLVTLPSVLTPAEVTEQIIPTFDRFLHRVIPVPGKDFCDMSKPFSTPFEEWSIVNCMLPTRYHPPFQNNIFEILTRDIARQLHPELDMVKDYDQLLNKRPGKRDAEFAWHQDMGYWPSPKVLGVEETATCTFSLAVDDSLEENGCLRYVPGSGREKKLREHKPLSGSRDEGHALVLDVDESKGDVVELAICRQGSVTVHDEWVVHGSGGNRCEDRQRRTYVLAYRPRAVVEAERRLGFTHSHNDEVKWDTFEEGKGKDECE